MFVRGLRSVYAFLPPAHRGARVIGTDALRIVLIVPEPSDGQERKQDNKDDPNINAHQSSPAAGFLPAVTQRVKESPGHRFRASGRKEHLGADSDHMDT